MERDYGREIDELKSSIGEILSIIKNETSQEKEQPEAKPESKEDREQNDHLMAIANRYTEQYKEAGGGKIAVVGSWIAKDEKGATNITWSSDGLDITELLNTTLAHPRIEDVLVCLGSNTKLSIVLALIKKDMSVSQLVEECGFGSTGQVYHHLQPLLSAGMVKESEDRGHYSVEGGTFIGIVEVFAGIRHWLT